MTNEYYTPTGAPATNATGASAPIRAQFQGIQEGFDKLPALSGNGNKAVVVNSGGTALSVTAAALALAVALTTTGSGGITLRSTATTDVTLPTTGTLSTLAGAESLSNKTLVSPTITTSPTAAGVTWTDLGSVTTVDVNGGTIDGTVIGGSSAAAASFTTLSATGNIGVAGGGTTTAIAEFGGTTPAISDVDKEVHIINEVGAILYMGNAAGSSYGYLSHDVSGDRFLVGVRGIGDNISIAAAGGTTIGGSGNYGLAVNGALSATGKVVLGGATNPSGNNSELLLTGNILLQSDPSIFVNTYYDGAYKFVANGYGANVSFNADGVGDVAFYSATSNAGGAGASYTPVEGLRILNNGAGISTPGTITGNSGSSVSDFLTFSSASSGTGANYARFINTGGTYQFGVENSANTLFGVGAYNFGMVMPASRSFVVQVAGTGNVTATSATGFDVTGNLSATKNGNADTTLTITNTTAGTAAATRLDLVSDSSGGQLTATTYSSTYSGTIYGVTAAKLKAIFDNSSTANSGGLLVGVTGANPLYFATNATVALTIDSSQDATFAGDVTVSGTISVSSANNSFTATAASLYLSTSASFGAVNNNNGQAAILLFGSSHATRADEVAIYGGNTEQITLDGTTVTLTGAVTLASLGGAVSVGAADSGGAGYKVLRVPN